MAETTRTKVKDAEVIDDLEDMMRPRDAAHAVAVAAATHEPTVLDFIEARQRVLERLTMLAVQSTAENHWEDFDGKPRLNSGGALVVARCLGIRWFGSEGVGAPLDCEKEVGENERGRWFRYVYEGTFQIGTSPVDVVSSIGICDSHDSFFGTEAGGGRELSEVNEGHIRKKARTNCIVNGISELTGLKGMTFERLKSMGLSLDPAKMSKVAFRGGAKGGGQAKEWTVPFGPSKGKTAAELELKDLTFFKGRLEQGLADPERAKYHKFDKAGLEAVEAELAKRAAAKAGGTAPAGAPAASAGRGAPNARWQRLQQTAAEYKATPEQLADAVRKETKKEPGPATEFTEADVEAVTNRLDFMTSVDGQ